eukprot:TRINITY_DN354_c0_g1_i6.p1 TRINITY_DN354_c0_g1~~TRINITY_DN354_c0_g1_i6.p1  ORF type:complete len:331 (-),score=34.35 TRINITY_DN354_c0_g1_i6:87-1079(-)
MSSSSSSSGVPPAKGCGDCGVNCGRFRPNDDDASLLCKCEHPEAHHHPCALSQDKVPQIYKEHPVFTNDGRCPDCGLGAGRHRVDVIPSSAALSPAPAGTASGGSSAADIAARLETRLDAVFQRQEEERKSCGEMMQRFAEQVVRISLRVEFDIEASSVGTQPRADVVAGCELLTGQQTIIRSGRRRPVETTRAHVVDRRRNATLRRLALDPDEPGNVMRMPTQWEPLWDRARLGMEPLAVYEGGVVAVRVVCGELHLDRTFRVVPVPPSPGVRLRALWWKWLFYVYNTRGPPLPRPPAFGRPDSQAHMVRLHDELGILPPDGDAALAEI